MSLKYAQILWYWNILILFFLNYYCITIQQTHNTILIYRCIECILDVTLKIILILILCNLNLTRKWLEFEKNMTWMWPKLELYAFQIGFIWNPKVSWVWLEFNLNVPWMWLEYEFGWQFSLEFEKLVNWVFSLKRWYLIIYHKRSCK